MGTKVGADEVGTAEGAGLGAGEGLVVGVYDTAVKVAPEMAERPLHTPAPTHVSLTV